MLNQRFTLFFALLSCLALAPSSALDLQRYPLAGSWDAGDFRYYVTYWGDLAYLIRSSDGLAWTAVRSEQHSDSFSVATLDGAPTGASIRLVSNHRWQVAGENAVLADAERIRYPQVTFVAKNADHSELHGTVLLPVSQSGERLPAKALVIFLNGEGPNPRTDQLPTALALLESGFAAAVFDQRHAGDSTGRPNDGSYWERSLRAADDATAVVHHLVERREFSALPIGVVGWSQGGWIGSIVARNVPRVAFYVNIAGNSTSGWKQWRHSILSLLHRSGASDREIEGARQYLAAFFGVMHGDVPWSDYHESRQQARGQSWWEAMKTRYVAEWQDAKEARSFAIEQAREEPSEDLRKVSVPALGIFFQYDGSTPPESAGDFAQALAASTAPSFRVERLPGLQHGSWFVQSYADKASRGSRRSQEVNEIIANWIDREISREAWPP